MQYKALWIASWYPNPLSPSNGDFIQRMGYAIGVPIIVLHACQGYGTKYQITDHINQNLREIICLYPIHQKGIGAIFINGWRKLRAYIRVFKYIQRQSLKFDIIHVHVSWPAALIVLLCRICYDKPLLITEHWSGLRIRAHENLGKFQLFLLRRLWKRAAYILPVSHSLSKDMVILEPRIANKMKVIPNVVDANLFKIKVDEKKPGIRFLFIGTLQDSIKNVSGIIKAFSIYHQENLQSELICLGEGPDLAEFIQLTKELSISQNVQFCGHVPHTEIADWMNSATALISFSHYENLPCVILEALMCGLPVITNETGDMYDWINDQNGILLQQLDVKSLSNAMQKVTRKTFDRKKIGQSVLQRCSSQIVRIKLMAIYQRVVSNQEGR